MPGKFRYSFPHASIIDPGDELVGPQAFPAAAIPASTQAKKDQGVL
jgi:hypothetical protein